jgi:hypothetical protein
MAGRNAASIAVRQDRAASYAAGLASVIAELREAGAETLRALANGLNERDYPAPRGGKWSAVQVSRLLARIAGNGCK